MRATSRYVLGMILLLGYVFASPLAEALITVQSLSGTGEVLFNGEQVWKPLPKNRELDVGDQVRTRGTGHVVLTWGKGSTVRLGDETRIRIEEVADATNQENQGARFKLLGGTITSKLEETDLQQNVFEIETDKIVVRAESSEGAISVSKDESQSDIVVQRGVFEIRQTGEGIVTIAGFPDDQEGIVFLLDSSKAWLRLGVYNDERKITLESNILLPFIRALISPRDSLEVKNDGNAPINVKAQGTTTTLAQGESAPFNAPDDREIVIETTGKTNIILWIKQAWSPTNQSLQKPRTEYPPRPAPRPIIESPISPE